MSRQTRRFKERLQSGELVPLFALARVAHPLVVEMFGLAGGYGGFWIDQEHGQFTPDQLLTLTMAARANEMDTFVRMAPTGYAPVTQCLEAGAGGVMAAQIHSARQAQEFVSWAKFKPEGARGMNMSGYDAGYTHKKVADFMQDANRSHLVAIQIETTGALDEADAIAATAGVDLLFVGPVDLSLSLDIPGQFHHERLWEAIGAVADACRRHGKHWGCVAPDPKFAERAVEQGCKMPTIGSDTAALRQGIAALQTAFTAAF